MEYYLMFHIDRNGTEGIVLKKTNDLLEMDNYITSNFKTRRDAFNYYEQDISEFCLDKRKVIQDENIRNNHNRIGAITLFGIYENNYGINTIKIPIIYGMDSKILPNNICLKKIKEKLNDDNVLKKIFVNKNFLLSKNERDLLKLYLRLYDVKYKKLFIDYFINRIKVFSEEKKYFFNRCLINICSLNFVEVKTKKGNIKYSLDMPTNIILEKESNYNGLKLESYLDDDFFEELIEKEDYENLNKYYDIETIERNSNYRKSK